MKLREIVSGKHTSAAMLLALLSALSKAIGFLREALIAWAFGTSPVTDAYRLCLSYTTYFSHLVFGEAMTGALVPYMANQDNEPTARQGVEKAASILALWVSVPICVAFISAPGPILGLLAPKLPQAVEVWAKQFLRVFGLAVPAYCLTSLTIISRQSRTDFRPLGWRPVGQSIAIMLGTAIAVLAGEPVLLPTSFGAYYLWLFLIVDRGHLFSLLRDGTHVSEHLPTLLRRWVPMAVGLGALQSNVLIERYFAAGLPTGTIAALDFARVIIEIPLLTIGVPTGAVILVALGSSPTTPALRRERLFKLCLAAVAALCTSALIVTFADTIASILYQRGAFGQLSVVRTAAALRGLGLGAWAVAGSYVAGRWLIATASPLSILPPAILSLMANFIGSTVLVPRLGIFGLALAQSAAFSAYLLAAAGTIFVLHRPSRIVAESKGD